ncbi:MAG: hypothetical protein HY094_09085 [Candidatus Melainabacteria bacterium]|nr:hypothetical protein [Candidatus Melainabacteria bacterium]
MPPRMPQRRPISRSRGSDPTVSIATASTARTALNTEHVSEEFAQEKDSSQTQANDDLKKLIETLKNKLGNNSSAPPQKKAPPTPQAGWNRSIANRKKADTNWKPAYTILTRISNHEKVPVRTSKSAELTINSLPHSFLYKPGADGIKIGKLDIKAGKQVGIG